MLMKNIKVSWTLDRFIVIVGTGERTEESAASSTQVVNSSYVCLVQGCQTRFGSGANSGKFNLKRAGPM